MMMSADWTYDLFCEDAAQYEAPAEKPQCWGCEREDFMQWLKFSANQFEENWLKSHKGQWDGCWVGDAFAETLSRDWFSDFYKDAYGQRPHLPVWFYVRATGLPMQEDTIRCFCADPVADAVESAKLNRERAW